MWMNESLLQTVLVFWSQVGNITNWRKTWPRLGCLRTFTSGVMEPLPSLIGSKSSIARNRRYFAICDLESISKRLRRLRHNVSVIFSDAQTGSTGSIKSSWISRLSVFIDSLQRKSRRPSTYFYPLWPFHQVRLCGLQLTIKHLHNVSFRLTANLRGKMTLTGGPVNSLKF